MNFSVKLLCTSHPPLKLLVESLAGLELYQDTVVYCGDSITPLHLPKLLVGLLFPELRDCEQFTRFPDNTLYLPLHSTMEVLSVLSPGAGQDGADEGLLLDAGEDGEGEELQEALDKEKPEPDYEDFLQDTDNFASIQRDVPHGLDGVEEGEEEFLVNKSKRKSYKGEIFPGEYPYKCSYCEKRFKQVGHANHHERNHTGTKKYECEVCKKRFNQRSHLNDHRRTHTGEKPYKCSHCGKCFAFSSGLKSHERTHSGERLFKCAFCKKSFNQKPNLRTHERLHTGDLKFMCDECGKCFNTKGNLTRHSCKPLTAIEQNTHTYVTMWQPELMIDQIS